MRGKALWVVPFVVLLSAAPGSGSGKAEPAGTAGAKTKLTVYAGSQYTPTRLVPGATSTPTEGFDPVVKAYMEAHPNVEIELIPVPQQGGQIRTWLITQLTGGTAPDITWTQPDWVNEDVSKKWWVAFDSYLEKPNPYISGNARWADNFHAGPMNVWRAADGKLYMLLGDQVQVGFYYNQDIFRQHGLSAPRNWSDLMNAARTLSQSGVVPFAMEGTDVDQITWISGWILNAFYADKVPAYDTDGGGWVSKQEIAAAVKNGAFRFDDERGIARLQAMHDMYQHAQQGWPSAERALAERLFVTGKTAMIVDGSWKILDFENDPLRTFAYGVFYFPGITPQYSPLVPPSVAPTNKAAGYGSYQYGVTNSAIRDNKVELAMDFLMFATAPQHAGPLIEQTGTALPIVKGAAANAILEPFRESVSYGAAPMQEDDSLFDFRFATDFLKTSNVFLAGSMTVQDAARRLQQYAVEAADRVMKGAE
jgi:raffinose/stachyose/melibiose transport system substrate-binding protein